MLTFVFTLDTGRLGDWVVVKAESETHARRALTRSQKRKIRSVRLAVSTSELRREAKEAGLPFPLPIREYKRRAAAAA